MIRRVEPYAEADPLHRVHDSPAQFQPSARRQPEMYVQQLIPFAIDGRLQEAAAQTKAGNFAMLRHRFVPTPVATN